VAGARASGGVPERLHTYMEPMVRLKEDQKNVRELDPIFVLPTHTE
jgi:hypothetical protein